MYEEHMLSGFVKQPKFLSYCSRNPILTYRISPNLFSFNLAIYFQRNDGVEVDFFQASETENDFEDKAKDMIAKAINNGAQITDGIASSTLESCGNVYSGISKNYMRIVNIKENWKELLLSDCKKAQFDSVYLNDKIDINDENLERDIYDIAELYLRVAVNQRRKEGIGFPEASYEEDEKVEGPVN